MKILEDIYKESSTTRKLHKVSKKIPIQKKSEKWQCHMSIWLELTLADYADNKP